MTARGNQMNEREESHYRTALGAIEGHFLPGDHERVTYSSDAREVLQVIRDTAREALVLVPAGCPCVGTEDEENCPHE